MFELRLRHLIPTGRMRFWGAPRSRAHEPRLRGANRARMAEGGAARSRAEVGRPARMRVPVARQREEGGSFGLVDASGRGRDADSGPWPRRVRAVVAHGLTLHDPEVWRAVLTGPVVVENPPTAGPMVAAARSPGTGGRAKSGLMAGPVRYSKPTPAVQRESPSPAPQTPGGKQGPPGPRPIPSLCSMAPPAPAPILPRKRGSDRMKYP